MIYGPDDKPMVTLITAIFGVVFGFGGLLLSILNFLRDRPRLVVRLKWDMAITDNPTYDPKKSWGIVRVTNVGRRPVYLAVVSLKLPKEARTLKGFKYTHLIVADSMTGKRLAEGDQAAGFVVNQDDMVKHSAVWRRIQAVAEDSTGKTYKSKKVREKPSWAKP
jgi:hypothetical protein